MFFKALTSVIRFGRAQDRHAAFPLSSDSPPGHGPPPIAIARSYARGRGDIRIDTLETEFHFEPGAIAVRAWLLVPLSSTQARSPGVRAARALLELPTETHRIFYLTAAYGLTIAQVAASLKLSRRAVRKRLLQAIAHLDKAASDA